MKTITYLGEELTISEYRELKTLESKKEYVNPYEAYGHHTAYGIEEKEQYITK